MTLAELKALRESGQFHHATYRYHGSLWEGLYIYERYDGLRGFNVAGVFHKDNPDLEAAYSMVRDTGISLGSYGAG